MKAYFDVVMIVPLEEELQEVLQQFKPLKDFSSFEDFRYQVDTGVDSISMLVCQQREMGRQSAMATIDDVLEIYNTSLVICLGIAGGISEDVNLCDVCYSALIVEFSENSKISEKDGQVVTDVSPNHYMPDRDIIAAMNFARYHPDIKSQYLEWQQVRKAHIETALPDPVIGYSGKPVQLGAPKTLDARIACTAVSKSPAYNKKLLGIDRKLVAVETESGPVFDYAARRKISALTIRGISDFADGNKNKLEVMSAGAVRGAAASNAASFLKFQFQNPLFQSRIHSRRNQETANELFELEASESISLVGEIYDEMADVIDDNLRKLSPEFKLHPKGYKLPVPRVSPSTSSDKTAFDDDADPCDLRDLIKKEKKIILNLNKSYPDQSLPWVICDDLCRLIVDEKQVIPIVIDGDLIKGRKFNFEKVCQVDLSRLISCSEVYPVFVIENIPFGSGHRMSVLLDEIDRYKESGFIFLCRGDVNFLSESAFHTQLSAQLYDMCEVSFYEISQFLQKNFEMSGHEAGVVALRLRDTFTKFDLDAHPTYFAGISRETLTALLQANRRSELIQLAVDGFLSFLVADDREEITLSRTTRSRFLRKLVIEMNVNGRVFKHEDIVKFTKSFADEMDFNIDPIAFVGAFIDQGIVHFYNDHVKISLPFIESYLLADELSKNPKLADKYFVDDMSFDLATFDLYSEIGASEALVSRVAENLKKSCDILQSTSEGEHILAADDIVPPVVRSPKKTSAFTKKLESASRAVKEGRDESSDKQAILDMAERIQKEVARTQPKIIETDEELSVDTDTEKLTSAIRHWIVATIMLGSGAEHLDASVKRPLCKMLVEGASEIIDKWTRTQSTLDFAQMKQEMTSDENLELFPGDLEVSEKRRLVSSMVDDLEYAVISEPFRKVISHLCEHARHKVLAASIENADVKGMVESIIQGTWLLDVEPKRGKTRLLGALRPLGRSSLFRILLSGHFLSRSYWNHHNQQDRLMLIEIASKIVDYLSLSVNKGKLLRSVKGNDR